MQNQNAVPSLTNTDNIRFDPIVRTNSVQSLPRELSQSRQIPTNQPQNTSLNEAYLQPSQPLPNIGFIATSTPDIFQSSSSSNRPQGCPAWQELCQTVKENSERAQAQTAPTAVQTQKQVPNALGCQAWQDLCQAVKEKSLSETKQQVNGNVSSTTSHNSNRPVLPENIREIVRGRIIFCTSKCAQI